MFLRLKPVVLFVSMLGISCFAINFLGFNSSLFAKEDKSSTKKEISSKTNERTACKATSGCDIKQAKTDHNKKKCADKSDCDTPCDKQNKCGKGDKGRCIDDMISMVRCEKKKLLKEKIRAKLEAKIGSKLDKVADLLVDSMLEDCKAGGNGDNKERREKLKEQLCQIFSEEKSK